MRNWSASRRITAGFPTPPPSARRLAVCCTRALVAALSPCSCDHTGARRSDSCASLGDLDLERRTARVPTQERRAARARRRPVLAEIERWLPLRRPDDFVFGRSAAGRPMRIERAFRDACASRASGLQVPSSARARPLAQHGASLLEIADARPSPAAMVKRYAHLSVEQGPRRSRYSSI
jgi:hypothetical protein